ncbi:unnamed protein product [marine sediment metagenome]|uniref:Uncharacterized protein n=1 Tax=marine sediment metagenome TaxID=412755 RepID=X1N2Q8_9ZZZZ
MRSERKLKLAPWEEVVGEFEKLENDDTLRVHMKCVKLYILEYDKNSDEARALLTKLAGWEGSRVGILRTDILEKPIMVRIVDEEGKKVKLQKKP